MKKTYILSVFFFIIVSTAGQSSVTLTFNGPGPVACNEPFVESGIMMTISNTEVGDCLPGLCQFLWGQGTVWIMPARLNGMLAGIGSVDRIEIDIEAWCNPGCTKGFLFFGPDILSFCENTVPGIQTLIMDPPGAVECTNFAISSCEAGILEIRIFLLQGVLITGVVTNSSSMGCTGAIDISVSGGITPYSYFWSNQSMTEDISGLCAGPYSVMVMDFSGSTAESFFDVFTDLPPVGMGACCLSDGNCLFGTLADCQLVNGVYLGDNTDCATANCAPFSVVVVTGVVSNTILNACTGSIDITLTGGVPPFSFLWSDGSTTEDRSELCAGAYTLTVTSGGQYTVESFFDVFVDLPPVGACCLPNGDCVMTDQAACAAQGGSYQGDNTDCLFVNCVPPSPMTITGFTTPTSATACTGTIDITVSGGLPPYSYLWSNGQTTEDLSGLCTGAYLVTVSSGGGGGYQIDSFFDIFTEITITGTTTPSSASTCTGSIDITVSGGVTPYNFLWSNGQTTEDLTGLCAGSYSVTAHGGDFPAESFFDVFTELTVTGVTTPTSATACTGTIDINVSGGVPPYSYLWSDGSSIEDRSELCAGAYSLTVTSGNQYTFESFFDVFVDLPPVGACCLPNGDCVMTDQAACAAQGGSYEGDNTDCLFVNCAPPLPMTVTGVTTPTSATVCTGTIDITVSGGLPPYSYLWSNGQTTEDLTGLCPGTYFLTVTGGGGGIADSFFDVFPEISVTGATTPSSTGGCTGMIDITVSGGLPPYSYLWSNGQTTEDITGLCAGNYSVTVHGGDFPAESFFDVFIELTVNGVTTPTSATACTGTIDITVSGGLPPYSYLWSNGQTTEDLSGLCTGAYLVTVSSGGGGGYQIDSFFDIFTEITITGTTTPSSASTCTGSIDITVSGGVTPYNFLWSNGQTTEDLTGLCAGSYSVTAHGGDFPAESFFDVFTELTVTGVTTPTSATVCTGTIDINVFGDVPPYSYLWSDGSSIEDRSELCAGTYSLTVTSGNQYTFESFFDVFTEIIIIGACCMPDGSCTEMSGSDCQVAGGVFQGTGSSCSLVNCGPITNQFSITIDSQGVPVGGGGTGEFSDPLFPSDYNGWYYYPYTEWWNIWFYDHPYDPDSYKVITISFNVSSFNPSSGSYLDFAVNWSAPAWSMITGVEQPPIPSLVGLNESQYIFRPTLQLWEGTIEPGQYQFSYIIPDYCPEWVSIDVRGYNFSVTQGTIVHECLSGTPPPLGRCCYSNANGQILCADNYESQCDLLSGIWNENLNCNQNPCSQDIGACCIGNNCINTTEMSCNAQGGLFLGAGTSCNNNPCPVTNYFWIEFGPNGINPGLSGGTDYFPGGVNGWYEYPTGWYNIWFYDHPFDQTRYKK
jgi:hypothetical protein